MVIEEKDKKSGPVDVVVLNWNQPALTSRCVSVLRECKGVSTRILVVDNGSTRENQQLLKELLDPQIKVLWLMRNLGFAGGMNAGIRYCLGRDSELIWLMNNDAFPEADCLAHLVHAMNEDPDLVSVSPRLVDSHGEEQHTGGRLTLHPFNNQYLKSDDLARPDFQTDWLTGTALLVKASFLRLNSFDTRYFAYWEDVDFHLRLAKCGKSFRAVPEGVCYHMEGVSSPTPFKDFLYFRNQSLTLFKHLPRGIGLAASFHAMGMAMLTASHLKKDFPERARAIIGAVWSICMGRYNRPASIYAPGWFENLVLQRKFPLPDLFFRASYQVERLSRWFLKPPKKK